MDPAPNRLIEIFSQAQTKASPAEREHYLAEACQGQPELRAQVEDLLGASQRAGDFLGRTIKLQPMGLGTEGSGTVIGRYKLLQQIGEGGCGVVYMAEQEEPIRRRVALKVIKLGMDTKQVIARFEAERQALALMDHPNIAKVLDAGATETGRPYFVMELVRGIRLTDYCDQNKLSTEQRLALFVRVCHAIQHAHQKGIIHRDIKPSNILVTINDGVPVPKVIDFGIAKATEQRLTDKTLFTAFEQFIGTPAYMSPEQAEMTSLDIDTRSDIYALGVLLYELLTGQTPFNAKELMAAGVEGMRRIIREQEPVRPSTSISTLGSADQTTVAERRQLDPPRLVHRVRGDLDWIVMKCLEKDRTRRYETANGLAQDIQRHLSSEPVTAVAPTLRYRLVKFARRNRTTLATASALLSLLVAGVVVSTWQAVRATKAERVQSGLRQQADQARRAAETAERIARQRAYASDVRNAQVALDNDNGGLAMTLLRSQRPQIGESELRGVEWRYLWQMAAGQDLKTYEHGALIYGLGISADGRWLVTSGADGRIRVWNTASGQVRAEFTGPNPLDRAYFDAVSRSVAASPTGSFFAISTASGLQVRSFNTLDVVTNLPGATFPVQFSGDGRLLAALHHGEKGHELRLWEVGSWRSRFISTNVSRIYLSLCFSLKTRQLVWTHARDSKVYRFDLEADRPQQPFPGIPNMTSLAISSDGRWMAMGNWDGQVCVLDFATGKPGPTWRAHPGWVLGLAFAPDDQILASGGNDQRIRFWQVDSWKSTGSLAGHESEIWDIAYARDGRSLFAASKDGTVRCFPSQPPPPRAFGYEFPVKSHGNCLGWAVSEGGERALILRNDSILETWDGANGRLLESRPVLLTRSEIYSSIRSSGSCAYAATNGDILLLDADAREPFTRYQVGAKRLHLFGLTPDARHLLAREDAEDQASCRLLLWNLATKSLEWILDEGKLYDGGSLSADGRKAVAFTRDSCDAVVWTVGRKEPVSVLRNHAWFLSDVTFSPDGKRVAIASWDGTVHLWDADAGIEVLPPLKGHRSGVKKAQFSNDGRTLITSDGRTVRLWNLLTGQEMLLLEELNSPLLSRNNGSLGWWLLRGAAEGQMRWCSTPLPTLAEIDAIQSPRGTP